MSSQKIYKFKIQPNIKNSFTDMFRCYKKVMALFVFVVGPVQVFSFQVIKRIGIRTGFTLPSWSEMFWQMVVYVRVKDYSNYWLHRLLHSKWGLLLPSWSEMFWQMVVYVLVKDYSNYWLHRLLHSKWGYEKIHRMHHEYTAPIGLAAPYGHWAEVLILGLPSFLGPMLVPGHMVTFWLWMIVRQMEAIDIHSGYDFSWSPTKYIPFYGGPEYHDYHHFVAGKSQSNFASVFTYCDFIYGTNKGYRYQRSIREGFFTLSSSLLYALVCCEKKQEPATKPVVGGQNISQQESLKYRDEVDIVSQPELVISCSPPYCIIGSYYVMSKETFVQTPYRRFHTNRNYTLNV